MWGVPYGFGTALLAGSESSLKLVRAEQQGRNYGNIEKSIPDCNIISKWKTPTQVNKCSYLETTITAAAKRPNEIQSRIGKGMSAL